jgi:hypothetical protein
MHSIHSIVESCVHFPTFEKLPLCESISQGIQESRPDFRSFVGLLDNTAYLFEWSRCSVLIGRISPILTSYSHVRLSTSWQHIDFKGCHKEDMTIDGSMYLYGMQDYQPLRDNSQRPTPMLATRKRSQFLVVQKR